MCHRNHLCSRYAAAFFKPKTDPSVIYLDTCNLLLSLTTETLESQHSHRSVHYFGRFGRPWKKFKVGPTLKCFLSNDTQKFTFNYHIFVKIR
ncbi:unnamed protein product [Hymenolepis diminuta]|uniref:Uncharacterized protein n=1 Tax=Hymenolepis diminuta TaxID=6216 RepID=A0A564XZZ5_HYMDI|nr:unnamed protein product [Hymenolepis diminuta]